MLSAILYSPPVKKSDGYISKAYKSLLRKNLHLISIFFCYILVEIGDSSIYAPLYLIQQILINFYDAIKFFLGSENLLEVTPCYMMTLTNSLK